MNADMQQTSLVAMNHIEEDNSFKRPEQASENLDTLWKLLGEGNYPKFLLELDEHRARNHIRPYTPARAPLIARLHNTTKLRESVIRILNRTLILTGVDMIVSVVSIAAVPSLQSCVVWGLAVVTTAGFIACLGCYVYLIKIVVRSG